MQTSSDTKPALNPAYVDETESPDEELPEYRRPISTASNVTDEFDPDVKDGPTDLKKPSLVDESTEIESTPDEAAPPYVESEQRLNSTSTPIGLNSDFVYQHTTAYKIHRKSKSWGRGPYVVENDDESNSLFLHADSKWYNYKRTVYDANETEVSKLNFSYWKTPIVFYINDTQGEHLAEIKGKWSWTKMNADMKFTNFDGQPMLLKLRQSSGRNGQFTITTEDDNMIAYINRRGYEKQQYKENKIGSSWDVHVAANADSCMVCCTVMGLDECFVLLTQSTMGAAGAASSSSAAAAAATGAGA